VVTDRVEYILTRLTKPQHRLVRATVPCYVSLPADLISCHPQFVLHVDV